MFVWKRSRNPKAKLRQLIGDYELPSFSTVAVSTLGLLREGADLGVIAERIMTDPGLAVRILRTVNSASFGMRQKVSNLQYATSLLGRARVESLVLTAAVAEALPSPAGLDLEAFWSTSAQRACLARAIAARVSPSTAMESFTAGLLQDMAIPLMAAAKPHAYLAILETASHPDRPLLSAEQATLGYNHAQVGAVMAETWELPESLITAIADHHQPGQRAPAAVEAVGHVAYGEKTDPSDLVRFCRSRLGVQPDVLDAMIQDATKEATSLAESITGRSSSADAA